VKGSSTCDRLRNRLEADRDALLRAIKAFVAFVRAYQNHKLSFVFPFADLDLGGLATQLGLLRLPRMKEILGRKIKGFTASDVHPITVPFLNRKREKQRQEQLKVDLAKREEELAEREKARNKPAKVEKERTRTEKRAAKKANVQEHWDELAREERLAKKLKQKKISVKEYEKLLRKNGGDDEDDDGFGGGSDKDSDDSDDSDMDSDDSDDRPKKKPRVEEDKAGSKARKVMLSKSRGKTKNKKKRRR